MHGQFIIFHRNLGKLYKLRKGSLPHIVLPCTLIADGKESTGSALPESGIQCFPSEILL